MFATSRTLTPITLLALLAVGCGSSVPSEGTDTPEATPTLGDSTPTAAPTPTPTAAVETPTPTAAETPTPTSAVETPTAPTETPTPGVDTPTASDLTPTPVSETPTAAPETPTATVETPTPTTPTPYPEPEANILYNNLGGFYIPTGGGFSADIDGDIDGTIDLTLAYVDEGGVPGVLRYVTAQAGAEALILRSEDGYAPTLAYGDPISQDAGLNSWDPGTVILAVQTEVDGQPGPWTGPFVGAPGYLGLQLSSLGPTLFGWFELSVDGETGAMTLNGYARNATPYMPIAAGQTE